MTHTLDVKQQEMGAVLGELGDTVERGIKQQQGGARPPKPGSSQQVCSILLFLVMRPFAHVTHEL